MAYCFKRRESVAKAARRLGCQQTAHAVDCLRQADRAEAIHCARKDIKKTRAVLRLFRTKIAKKDYRRLTRLLREAADRLSAPRDAFVKAQTIRRLRDHFKGELTSAAFRHSSTQLRRSLDEEMKRYANEGAAVAVERTLHRVANQLKGLTVSGKGWKALSPGVKTSYRRGRRAYQVTSIDSSPQNFHEWRKRAKDLWYLVRLLQPVWREQMEAMAGELDALGKKLGEDHDLHVLAQDLEAWVGNHALETSTLRGSIAQRQGELRIAAMAIGARFYAEKSSVFCHRLAGYWHTWRKEKKRPVRSEAL